MRHGAALHVLLPLAGMIDRLANAGSTTVSATRALTTAAAVMNCVDRLCAASDGHTCMHTSHRQVEVCVAAAVREAVQRPAKAWPRWAERLRPAIATSAPPRVPCLLHLAS